MDATYFRIQLWSLCFFIEQSYTRASCSVKNSTVAWVNLCFWSSWRNKCLLSISFPFLEVSSQTHKKALWFYHYWLASYRLCRFSSKRHCFQPFHLRPRRRCLHFLLLRHLTGGGRMGNWCHARRVWRGMCIQVLSQDVVKHVYCISVTLWYGYLEEPAVEWVGKSAAVCLAHGPKMLQIPLGSCDDYTTGIQSSMPSYILDNLARFVKAGPIRDGVQNKEDVCIRHNALKLLFGVLKELKSSSGFMKQFHNLRSKESLLLVIQVYKTRESQIVRSTWKHTVRTRQGGGGEGASQVALRRGSSNIIGRFFPPSIDISFIFTFPAVSRMSKATYSPSTSIWCLFVVSVERHVVYQQRKAILGELDGVGLPFNSAI